MAIHKFILVLLGISWFFLSGSEVTAQEKQGANWLFGGKVHLDFNKARPSVKNYSFKDTLAYGVATISDKNGNLLFFSSGGRVSTRRHINGVYQEMPNGNLFSGNPNSTSTSEMIVQSPADSNIYYLIFTEPKFGSQTERSEIVSVEIDMRLNNGLGDVVLNSRTILRRNISSFKLSAFLHSNNRDSWIVTSTSSISTTASDSIVAFLLNPNGIMSPVVTRIIKPLEGFSRMKGSPNSEIFVAGGRKMGQVHSLELFEFNRATGVPTHKYSLPNPDNRYHFFSFAFSPDNTRLYTGTNGPTNYPKNATVYQYDLTAGSEALVQQSRNIVFNSSNYYAVGDMQLAIDGKIYLYISDTHLSQINCPNYIGSACRFQLNSLELKKRINGGALPALNQTIFRNAGKLQAQANRNVICEGDTIQLSAYGAGAEQFKWSLANGLAAPSDTLNNPLVKPTVTTTYRVIGSSVCHTDTAFVKVTVVPKPKAISVSGPLKVHTFAEKQQYVVQTPIIGNKYTWEVNGGVITSGQSTASILVTWGTADSGTVSVTETNEAGCIGARKQLLVEVSGEPLPVFYNIITPNNDGKNDAFVIGNLKWHQENELKIYNRWGQQVYQSSNYQNNWQAEKLSAGVYYYRFTANGKSWKGWVEVIK